jgi:hypothetical protein
MLTLKTEVDVRGVVGKEILDYLLNCADHDYQRWWPGTHLAFHTIKRYPGDLGNEVYFDEYVGKRRLKFQGIVTEVTPGERIVWQMKMVVKLPAWLILECKKTHAGIRVLHTLMAGFTGIGRIFDPLLRAYLSKDFERDLELHAKTEFPKLAELLARG